MTAKNFNTIKTEKDLLEFFYRTNRLRFLIGQSISWPYPKELVGRITFALEEDELVKSLELIYDSLEKLAIENSYHIRLNTLEDQSSMAKIKIDSWRHTYKGIIDEKYLSTLNYDEQTEKYIDSFEEYKRNVLSILDQFELIFLLRFPPLLYP